MSTPREFLTTRWSIVLAAQDGSSRDAMERLRTGAVDSASATGVFASSLGELRRSIRELNDQVARFRTSPDPTEG